ncbi:shikimate kinase [Parapedobacter deserti]|uniref:Shikimate kinase n=1 Tax=Parapedobacter deserti TaxID=1912957 RepID=A0ABV7JE02_9SPHI
MSDNSKPVFLVGFMGSGKTTWGRKLAAKTKRPFIDLDDEIVSATGMAITDYFALHGEAAFRELERDKLKSLSLDRHAIVSTGGGTPCYFDNMAWMNQTGTTVYLYLPPKALWDRLMQTDIAARPALRGLSGDELLAYITTKLEERTPYYEQATHQVNQLSLQLADLIRLIG